MIAVDTNVLVYADREETPQHRPALRALRKLAEGREAWALPMFSVGEFVRVVSHPRVFDPPTPAVEALDSIQALLRSPSARLLVPGAGFLSLFRDLVSSGGVSGNLTFDAQIAAVCLEHGARNLLTEDRDLRRFPDIAVLGLAEFHARGRGTPGA